MPLFIYSDNIENNVKKIKEKTNKDIIAVVKSNAYGMGTNKIIPLYKKCGINFFAFDKYLEFEKSKQYFSDDLILIMGSTKNELIEKEINPNIRYSVNSLIDALKVKDIKRPITVHLQFDSGMNRVGIRTIDELKWVISLLKTNELINIEGLYTHFSSDNLESKYFAKQVNLFEKCQDIYPFKIIHANATKTLHKKKLGNYVRVGMALFGYHQPFLDVVPSISLNVRPCSIFKTTTHDKIGYTQEVNKNTIGVINLGYSDLDFTQINNLYHKKIPLEKLGKSCMNHTHFISNDKINYLSWLSIFPSNDIIIGSDDYDWYRMLVSLNKMPKNYIKRRNYDIPKIFKYQRETCRKLKLRKRSS